MIVGIGIDLVEIERMRALLDRKGDRALRRLFTERELSYASRRSDPVPHLAARIAAKEATFKAFAMLDGARAIGWREMEVVSEEGGRPSLLLHGVASRLARQTGVARTWLSLSHTTSAAGAVVVLER